MHSADGRVFTPRATRVSTRRIEQNLEKLLAELQGVSAERRTARYQCVIALVRHADDADPLIAHGAWEGSILTTPRGSGGFGYDPIFLPEGLDLTAAELDASEKNARSHRGKALQALVARLEALPQQL